MPDDGYRRTGEKRRDEPAVDKVAAGRGPTRCGALQSGLDEFGQDAGDFGIAFVGFVLLTVWRVPPVLVVAVSALGGIALALAKW